MQITENAKKEILKNAKFLKIIAEPGGCAGIQYSLVYKNECDDEQIVEECILTDEISQQFLANTTLDFVEEPGCREFVITNPAHSTCGCGKSFSI